LEWETILEDFPGLKGQMHKPKQDLRTSKEKEEGPGGEHELVEEGDTILQTWLSAWEGLARVEGATV
jgi:hypothetical protein